VRIFFSGKNCPSLKHNKRSWSELTKKVLILGLLLIFSFGLIKGVTSYTSAEVNSEATLKIVASEDALIGVPENCVIDSIELELGENNYYDKYMEKGITNNMSVPIIIQKGEAYGDEVTLYWDETRIEPGVCVPIKAKIEVSDKYINNLWNSEKTSVTQRFNVTYNANWSGGNAQIEGCSVELTLKSPPKPEKEILEGTGGGNPNDIPDLSGLLDSLDTGENNENISDGAEISTANPDDETDNTQNSSSDSGVDGDE